MHSPAWPIRGERLVIERNAPLDQGVCRVGQTQHTGKSPHRVHAPRLTIARMEQTPRYTGRATCRWSGCSRIAMVRLAIPLPESHFLWRTVAFNEGAGMVPLCDDHRSLVSRIVHNRA